MTFIKYTVQVTLLVLGLTFAVATSSSNGTDNLQMEVMQLKSEVQGLKAAVSALEGMVTNNIADQLADKTIDSIQTNNQKDANTFWSELLNHAKQTNCNRTDELLTKIVNKSYSGRRTNFYSVLEFIIKNNVTQGFPKLYSALDYHNHMFDGQEIFVLAHYLREACGESTQLYENLPTIVKDIVTGPILFKNKDNRGYVIATAQPPCQTREECYGAPKTEAFVYRTNPHTMKEGDILQNPRAQWQFIPPITMDMKSGFNGTRMAWGFHLRSISEKKFLITKLRMTTFFLRNDTNFDSYYVKDLQCQYQPMLVKGDENSIRLAVVEKYLPKTEFIYGGNWGKKGDKIQLGRRAQYRDELEGLVWDIGLPTGSTSSEEGMSDENEMASKGNNMVGVDDSARSNSKFKCQF